MSKIEISEEQIKKWREEFEKNIFSPRDRERLYDDPDQYRLRDIQNQWLGHLAAKTSSYEREQELLSQIEKIPQHLKCPYCEAESHNEACAGDFKKLQERITELEKQNETYRTISMKLVQKEHEIEKRDQLIEQAELFVHASINGGVQGEHFNKCEEWLKQYEEMKR